MLELAYNEETKEWEQKKEPFITIEVETEEDFEFIGNAIAFYKKNIADQEKPKTRADRIRAMSDEELAKCLLTVDDAGKYCKNLQECEELLDTPEGIPEEKCLGCLVEWLREPEGE